MCFRNLKKIFRAEVDAGLKRTSSVKAGIITENDLVHLPPIVQKYLTYCGVVGQEKAICMRITCEGRIRSKPDDVWMTFESVQYNFLEEPTRLFFIKATKNGIPATGLHMYRDETATMEIKLAGLFKIVDAKGIEMNKGETVTVFNDMCLLAPSTLTDTRIEWEIIDSLNVNARFTNGNISVVATLVFNDKGEMINFLSNDRYETADGKNYKNYPWSTPVHGYSQFNRIRIVSSASLIFSRPESDFCYGEFRLKEVEYNIK
jgi:hypothetical protein